MSSAEPNAVKADPKKFTGYHATMIIVGFFGVVASVNFLMASLAIGSFSGTVVDNSYVASQKYNEWLEQGQQQAAYGWDMAPPTRDGQNLQLKLSDAKALPLEESIITAVAEHPVGRTESFSLSFNEKQAGVYTSNEPLPIGRWKLKISIQNGERSSAIRSEIK